MRVVKAVTATAVLLLAVLGTPLLLLRVGRIVDPSGLAGRDPWELLTTPDDGTLLFTVLTVVAWVAWALFTLCVGVELLAVLTRWRIRIRLPGLRFPQAVAAGLVLAAVSLVVSPVRVDASPAPPAPTPVVQTIGPVAEGGAVGTGGYRPGGGGSATGHAVAGPTRTPVLAVHTVSAGDDLWTLADRYYGDGSRWRAIAVANADRLDRHGPDDLQVGWRLVVPRDGATQPGRWVVAVTGDTLAALAERHLGDPDRWPELHRLNRAVISDPDELAVGTPVRLPAAEAGGGRGSLVGAAGGPDVEAPAPTESPAGEGRGGETEPRDRVPDRNGGGGRQPGPGDAYPAPAETAEVDAEDTVDPALLAGGVAGVLAAGMIAGVAGRRSWQLHHRPVGRRITHPGPMALRLERALGRRQDTVSLALVDRALRLIAGWCHATGAVVPRIVAGRLGPDGLELETTAADLSAPPPFVVGGRVWTIPDPLGWSATPDPYPDVPVTCPTLITLGTTADGGYVLLDLEQAGVLAVGGGSDEVTAVLTAVAMEAAFCRWSAGVRVTVLSRDAAADDWIEALAATDVRRGDDVDLVLDRIEARVSAQRAHLDGRWFGDLRLDPDTVDPWTAEVLVVNRALSAAQRGRLHRLISDGGPVSVAAVVADADDPHRGGSGARLTVSGVGVSGVEARLRPSGVRFTAQQVDAELREALSGLISGTGSGTDPAPWWDRGDDAIDPPVVGSTTPPAEVDLTTGSGSGSQNAAARPGPRRGSEPSDPVDTDNVTVIRPRRARPSTSSATHRGSPADPPQEVTAVVSAPVRVRPDRPDAGDPVVRLLGTIDLIGARGEEPPRARRQCVEYCAWLLEHPGSTATAMAAGLVVAEGTRRSNMSRLRAWLGDGLDGPYLPDAYSGRITLDDSVSSDWQRLQLLITGGVNRASATALAAGLELVRGAPLADAAPGQWHWAEELRTDMISVIRDLGIELTGRALADGDIDLARWAAARALVAAAGDEQLMAARLRTEHQAGNAAEVQRLALQITAQSRRLGVDLADETVSLIQQVVEGTIRPRRAR